MKKLLLLNLAITLFTNCFSFSKAFVLPIKAADVYLLIGIAGNKISLLNLSTINVKNFEKLSGRHLNFFERLDFKMAQRKLRKSIGSDGIVTNRNLNNILEQKDPSTGFHMGGFALGLFLNWLGVLIAYLSNDKYKKNRVKWAWIGFGISSIFFIIIILSFKIYFL